VRLLVDSNVVAQAVRALRDVGHDITYVAERAVDPGDAALLAEATAERRIFLTKDHDVGALVYRDLQPHSGVLLVDDLGNAAAETDMILATLSSHGARLEAGAFLRATELGIREPQN